MVASIGLVALTAATASARASTTRVGHAPHIPLGAVARQALGHNVVLRVDVTLQPRHPAGLAQYAQAVSTPGSALFHHYISPAQFADQFGPTRAAIRSVTDAIRAAGLRPGTVSANDLSIPIRASAGALSAAFSTGFRQYALPSGRVAYANTSAPEVAASAAPFVQGVVGLDSLSVAAPAGGRAGGKVAKAAPANAPTSSAKPAASGPQSCAAQASNATANDSYTMNQIGAAYGFTSLYSANDLGYGQVVGLFELQGYKTKDVAAFEACYGVSTPVYTVNVDGGPSKKSGVGEADIDIETVASVAPDVKILDYQSPDTGTGAYENWSAIVSQDAAKVVSGSWILCEDYEGSAAAQAENTLFEEAATQGQTILSAAGDWGSEACVASDASNDELNVDDPASQPFVTGVGGTQWNAFGTPPSETTWNSPTAQCAPEARTGCWGAGGGGISSLWTMPSYQSGAAAGVGVINAESSDTPCGAASGYCREVPDVSGLSGPYPYWMYVSNSWGSWGGTSLASPLWAGLIALTNASTACAGTTVGFANPLLYSVAGTDPSAFHDITTGENDLTGGNGGSFPALTGYDEATGIGTPNGAVLPHDLCEAGTTTDPVTVTSPGSHLSYIGTTASVQVHATDSTPHETLSYSAYGLPTGLSISSSGLISGTVTTSGAFSPVIIAEDGAGEAGTSTFAWSVPARVTKISPTKGPASGGTKVAIHGSGFVGATEVIFGATTLPASSFTVNKAGTKITVHSPGGSGTAAVQVVGPSGTSQSTPSTQFTYNA